MIVRQKNEKIDTDFQEKIIHVIRMVCYSINLSTNEFKKC